MIATVKENIQPLNSHRHWKGNQNWNRSNYERFIKRKKEKCPKIKIIIKCDIDRLKTYQILGKINI